MSYFDENKEATSYYVDEVAPIPPRNTWGEMSIPQLIDLKTRLINYQFGLPKEATLQQRTLAQGVDYLDHLINNPKDE